MDLDLLARSERVNEQLARYGVKFGIYKNNTFHEQLFPFDVIPRVIGKEEFAYLERGLKQRVMALNLFLSDIYNDKKIVRDKVVPEEFIYASSGYLAQCEGIHPPKDVFSHISGIDLVLGKDGVWYILEDNLRAQAPHRPQTVAAADAYGKEPHTAQALFPRAAALACAAPFH